MNINDDMKFTVRMEYFRNPGAYVLDREETNVTLYNSEGAMRRLASTLTEDEVLIQFFIFPSDYRQD